MSVVESNCFICAALRGELGEAQVLDDRSADFVILLCPRCHVPMAVLRSHEVIFPPQRRVVVREALFAAAEERFEGGVVVIDTTPHEDTTHLCWHARHGV